MDLKINLSTRAYFDARLLNAATVAVIAILILAVLVNVRTLATNAGQKARLVKDVAALDARFATSAKGVSERDYQELLKKIASANGILKKRGLDWLLLLNRLEEVVPEGVAISSIEPNLKDGTLKLSGTARQFRNLRMLVENLEAAPRVTDVYLQSQTDASVGTTQKGVTFSVTCKVSYS
ncbi:MAG: fimbrial protein [Desulfuromonadales bacterium]|nr:MAG: fimbrial protein [Desulfuromonadales bacterium]